MSYPVSTEPPQGLGDIDSRFRHPRQPFNRKIENRPYIDLLQEYGDVDYPDEESDGYSSGDEPVETNQASWSPIRRLSKRLGETDNHSPDPHQDAQVVKFVEYGLKKKPVPCEGSGGTLVALIDDQIDAVGGHPSRGGLTQSRLREHLGKPRFMGVPGMVPGHPGGQPGDVKRRVIGVPALAAPEMDILAATVSMYQKDPFMKFLRHHININPCIEWDMPSSGYATLSFQLHIPYVVLRQQTTPFTDPRQRPNGEPLRGSWLVNCIPAKKPNMRWYLYEAQRSIAVVVTDERVWTALGTTDTFFDGPNSKDSAEYRHKIWENHSQVTVHPISGDMLSGTDGLGAEGGGGDHLLDPCHFFHAGFESAIKAILLEYGPIVTIMEAVVKKGYQTEAADQFKDHRAWNDDALDHIQRIMGVLSKWLDAWKYYQQDDARHLNSDTRYLPNIKRSMRTLERYHSTLTGLEQDLKKNDTKINQKINAEVRDIQNYVLKLAIIAVLLTPLSQAMSVFNMPGLPFGLSVGSFVATLLVIEVVWVVCITALDPVVRFWHIHVRRYLGHVTRRMWERVLSHVPRGKLEEAVELQELPELGGSTALARSTALGGSATTLRDSLQAMTGTYRLPRSATWPMFPPWRGNERQDDPGHAV